MLWIIDKNENGRYIININQIKKITIWNAENRDGSVVSIGDGDNVYLNEKQTVDLLEVIHHLLPLEGKVSGLARKRLIQACIDIKTEIEK